MNPQAIELRDIHLPDPVSWWPLAPGWWLLLLVTFLVISAILISLKVYRSKQLKRDIKVELALIKQQYQQTQNKSQLAKSLSALLRRACISFYPKTNSAGLTGEDWLNYLDKTSLNLSDKNSFASETGKILLNAPYLPDNARLDFDAIVLITLCENWLLAAHAKPAQVQSS